MKKIEKFFKNTNISINEKHKEETKDKILEFYQPVKRGINLYKTFKFAALAAACLIIVSVSIIKFSNKFSFSKSLTTPSIEEYEKFKTVDKDSDDKSKDKIVKSDEDKAGEIYFDKTKITLNDVENRKSEKSVVMAPKKIESEDKAATELSVMEKEPSVYINSIKLEKTNLERLNAAKSSDIKKDELSEMNKSKRAELREKEEALGTESKKSIVKDESAAQENFINTGVYNKVSFKPNISINSFYYLNNQLSQNLAVDQKNIKDEEVINYFTKEDIAGSKEEIFIEGTLKSSNFYYFLINLEPKDYFIKDLSITFDTNVSNYYLYGYSEDIGKNYITTKNIIKNNHASIFLILQIENLKEEIARLDIMQGRADGYIGNLEQRIRSDKIKDINSASMKLKKAILGYMILSELKSGEFTKSEIIEYKNKSISGLPSDLESLYKNYINFKGN